MLDIEGWRLETMSEDMDGAKFTQPLDRTREALLQSTRKISQGEQQDFYTRKRVSYLSVRGPDARALEAFEHCNSL